MTESHGYTGLAPNPREPEEMVRSLASGLVAQEESQTAERAGRHYPISQGEARLSTINDAPGITVTARVARNEQDGSTRHEWSAHFYNDRSTVTAGSVIANASVKFTVGSDNKMRVDMHGSSEDFARLADQQLRFADSSVRSLARANTVVISEDIASEDLGEHPSVGALENKITRIESSAHERQVPERAIEDVLGPTAEFRGAVSTGDFLYAATAYRSLEESQPDTPPDSRDLLEAAASFQQAIAPSLHSN